MQSIEHLNSEQFIHLVQQDNTDELLEGNYTFNELQSGIHIHGGAMHALKNMQCSQLVDSYINFIVLHEGTLCFAINHTDYNIAAEGGKIIMVAIPQESVFTRYLVEGEYSAKVAVKGIEKWLQQHYQAQAHPALFDETVRIWPLNDTIKQLSQTFLQAPASTIHGQLMQEANALLLLATLWQVFEKSVSQYTKEKLPNPQDAFAVQINRVFEPKLHVNELAKRMNMSERTLQRRTQDHFGISISEWLRHKKMKYALYSLKHSELSIGEIAYDCGYKHVSNFTQAFKQYFQYTPTEIKQQ